MLIDRTDVLWPQLRSSILLLQGPNPPNVGLSDDDFAFNKAMGYFISVMKQAQVQALQPTPTAVASAQANVDSNFDAQLAKPVKT